MRAALEKPMDCQIHLDNIFATKCRMPILTSLSPAEERCYQAEAPASSVHIFSETAAAMLASVFILPLLTFMMWPDMSVHTGAEACTWKKKMQRDASCYCSWLWG
mmetsp:Transcript_106566/g.205024  ORF Transcript_106566/g.205024 Transcript_106566/m.205024 type:complete len:105 (+) Transcript_106566:633-947(+)